MTAKHVMVKLIRKQSPSSTAELRGDWRSHAHYPDIKNSKTICKKPHEVTIIQHLNSFLLKWNKIALRLISGKQLMLS